MYEMKRLFVFITGMLASYCLYSQTMACDPQLVEYRKGLESIDSLMKNGIVLDDVSGLKYHTPYENKTLHDWEQYFGAILQIYMGWPSDYIRNRFMKNGVKLCY